MKKLLSLFFAISLTLSACGTATSQPAPPTQTGTPTVTPTTTQTPTSTITPLPTIPTFTPTFDVSTIVTFTPAEQAECPVPQKYPIIKLLNFGDYYPELISALNQGASIEKVIDIFEQRINQHDNPAGNAIYSEKIRYELVDLTGDEIPEIILQGNGFRQRKSLILGCAKGEYKILLSRAYPLDRTYLISVDANQNGINEVILVDEKGSTLGSWFNLSVIEWHKDAFQILLSDVESNSAFQSIQVDDIDNDKTKEIIWSFSEYLYSFPPWRTGIDTYKWDGKQFVRLPIRYDPPQYLFQALQDGDRATRDGNFVDAEKAYQETILNSKLEWWSEKRQNDTMYNINNEGWSAIGTPALGTPDPAEYPSLAAYAYYRIMLLHIVQGQEAEAASTYQTLQETFGNDPYAAPYVEMATAFWDSYQSTQRMYDGCAVAIQYTVEHPEILIPLGSDYHGAQSHIYKPADVCPFR
jgi:hypothetical protein